MARNLPTYYLKMSARRIDEVPKADWIDGVNLGGSNAIGIGIATATLDPPAQDWARLADTDNTGRFSEHLGHIGSPIGVIDSIGVGFDRSVGFVQADGNTEPNGTLDGPTEALNRAGVTVPAGTWIWGVIRPQPVV